MRRGRGSGRGSRRCTRPPPRARRAARAGEGSRRRALAHRDAAGDRDDERRLALGALDHQRRRAGRRSRPGRPVTRARRCRRRLVPRRRRRVRPTRVGRAPRTGPPGHARRGLDRCHRGRGSGTAERYRPGWWSSARRTLGSPPDRKGETMVAPDGAASDAGILDGIRIVDLSDGIAGPVSTLLLAEAGADVVAVEPPGWRDQPCHAPASTPGCAASAASCSTSSDAGRPGSARRPAGRRRRAGAQPRPDPCARARPRRRRPRGAPPAAHRVVGAVVAGQPPRRRPPGDELLAFARLGILDEQQGYRDGPIFLRCPIGSWCAAAPRRDRDRRPPDRRRAHRARRARPHEHRPGRTGADGDALATCGTAVTVPGGRHAQGADRRLAVRVRRRRLDAPDG